VRLEDRRIPRGRAEGGEAPVRGRPCRRGAGGRARVSWVPSGRGPAEPRRSGGVHARHEARRRIRRHAAGRGSAQTPFTGRCRSFSRNAARVTGLRCRRRCAHDVGSRRDVHLVRPRMRRGTVTEREGDPHRPVVRQSPEPEAGRGGRPVRCAARHPWPCGPHGRRGRARESPPTGLAGDPRDEPVARATPAGGLGGRHRHEQGRDGRGRRAQGHDDRRGPLGRGLERRRRDDALSR
jgi:hypothetical protein